MKSLKKYPNEVLNKNEKLELENKILKEQLEKAYPTFNLEKVNKATYLQKKYLTLIYLIEFIIIFCLKDISRFIAYELKIAPSDLFKKLFKLMKGSR